MAKKSLYSVRDMRSTRLDIDVSVLENNARWFRKKLPSRTELMAVVKANGYGHGAVAAATAFIAGGASSLGVATLDEALCLRKKFDDIPIMIMGPLQKYQMASAVYHRLVLTISNPVHLRWLHEVMRDRDDRARVHLKVNTGMNRLGLVNPIIMESMWKRMKKNQRILCEGIFSHFFAADSTQKKLARQQVELFKSFTEKIQTKNSEICYHIANTAGFLENSNAAMDRVRIGIGLYGYTHKPGFYKGLHPALVLKTRIVEIQEVATEKFVSYGDVPVKKKVSRVGVIPVGYADGWKRTLSNRFRALVRGYFCGGVGNICMDMCMVDLSGIPSVRIGDEVTLIGKQGGNRISAEEVAQQAGTIVYEILTSFSDRMPRYYRQR